MLQPSAATRVPSQSEVASKDVQSGRSCKRNDGAGRRGDDTLFDVDVDADGERVHVRLRGRLIRTLTGADAAAVRDVLDDPDRLQRLLVSKTKGNRS